MNGSSRTFFTFYESFFVAIDKLESSEQLSIYKAIAEYALYRKEPDLDGMALVVWALIRPNLDFNWKQWENSKKGGAPFGNNNAVKQPKNNPETTQKQPKFNQAEKTLFSEAIDFEKLAELFNSKTGGRFGTIKTPLSESRKKMIKARIKDFGKESFVKVIDMATKSEFLSGQNSRGFMMTFDWMIKPTNFEKILSGNYNSNVRNGKYNKNNPIGSTRAKDFKTEL